MADEQCGCDAPQAGEYLLVKSTPSEAAICSPTSAAGTESCAKQEPEFDQSLSDFMVPLVGSSIGINVCNGSVYTVNQYVNFTEREVILRITAIAGNTLTVSNSCSDGSRIRTNPDAGMAIGKYSAFIVSAVAPCANASLSEEILQEGLSVAEELCVPALKTSPSTAVVAPVGRVESDSNDSGIGKCIRMIYGFMFDKGTPIFSRLVLIGNSQRPDYRPLMKHKTNNKVVHAKNYSEQSTLLSNKRYALSVQKSDEHLAGPLEFARTFHTKIAENISDSDPTNWPNTDGDKTVTITIPQDEWLTSLIYDTIDYKIMMRLTIGVRNLASYPEEETRIEVRSDGNHVCKAACGDNNRTNYVSASMPVKILKSANSFELRISSTVPIGLYYRVDMDGVFF